MKTAGLKPEQILGAALNALYADPDWKSVLDELPVPVYTIDPGGTLTYWNCACIAFAGRVPEPGRDRWCVSWKMYTTTGEYLPHEESPTAQAIKKGRMIRDTVAIAERPDGSRRAFRSYPTLLFDKSSCVTGAVNLLIDVTDEQGEALCEEAERCRRLARATYNRQTASILSRLADGFERTAGELRQSIL